MSLLQSAARLSSEIVGALGVNRTLRASHRRCLLILNYHGVVPDELAREPLLYPNVIGVTEFTRHMSALARLFRPVGLAELHEWRIGSLSFPPNPALVTFDDGYRNNLTWAVPVLEHFGIPAVIHVTTGHIGRTAMLWPDEIFWRVLKWPERMIPVPRGLLEVPAPAEWASRVKLAGCIQQLSKRLSPAQLQQYLARLQKHPEPEPQEEIHSFLSWEELRQLQFRGFMIGSHTLHHPILSRLPLQEAAYELQASKRLIEEMLGGECGCFAYPNGGAADLSPEIVEQVRRAGYSFAFTVQGRLASPGDDPLMLDRVYVPGAASMAEFHNRVSGFHPMLKHWLGN